MNRLTTEKLVETDFNPLNTELNPIYHLLALLGGATIVVVNRLRVKYIQKFNVCDNIDQ
jgi:hypothetical protein